MGRKATFIANNSLIFCFSIKELYLKVNGSIFIYGVFNCSLKTLLEVQTSSCFALWADVVEYRLFFFEHVFLLFFGVLTGLKWETSRV